VTVRNLNLAAELLLAAQVFVLALVLARVELVLLPVTADFGGGIQIAEVNLGAATLVLLVFSAACRAAAVRWATPVIRWVEWSQVSAIVVFLVAQLNGVRDVAALVALYALTAGASLFLVLHERAGAVVWPFSFGAAVGIVPWGVIAFYQVGAIAIGDDPSFVVRAVTIVMLLASAAYWYVSRALMSERAHTTLVVLLASAFAWLSVLAG